MGPPPPGDAFRRPPADARGYLLKGANKAEILHALKAVVICKADYGAAVARRIVEFFTGAHQQYAARVFPKLTECEREVLELVAAGSGNHEIVHRLVLSETVRSHVSAILGGRCSLTSCRSSAR
jgi:DNA-binding NarL/FixJ family response regulator